MIKKKIIFIVTSSAKTLKYIIKDQPKYIEKHFIVYVVSSEKKMLEEYAKKYNLKHVFIPMFRKINPFYDLYSIILLLLSIYHHKPDIIHSYTPKAGLICSISGFLMQVPKRLHTFTGLIFPYKFFLMKSILAMIDSLICFLNTHVIAEGNGVKTLLILHKITSKKIYIIGNGNIAGVDLNYFSKNSKKERHEVSDKLSVLKKIKSNATVFIFAGRINKDKGVEELIKSFRNLNSDNSFLLIIGEFESKKYANHFKQLLYNHSNIMINKWENDLRPFLENSNCLILPSYREGFPNIVLQAGAMQLPSIVTNIPGSNEIITNNKNGLICNPRDWISLMNAMRLFLSMSVQERSIMGINAKKNIHQKYDQNIFRNELIKFYNEL
jgi:glycosyltransferase involved in cell wall biosynthesis